MAIYHLSVKPVSRAGGRSATAAAAYRAAEIIHDQTSGEVFDYTRKRGVEHTEIVLPTECAKRDINWARNRQQLWNAAEIAENRSNSRVAREYELALPHELNHTQRVELVRAFSTDIADRYGVGVDFAVHAPHWKGDDRNHHAHVLTTTRTIEAGGLGEKSEIEWSDGNRRKAGLEPAKEEITLIRARWETLTNEYLHEQGIEARIDHRSLAAQGIEREPQVHLGPAVSGMQRRGMETEVGKRLELEGREALQQRLELAAEAGKIEREQAQVQRSILDLSGDLEKAKRERDLQLSNSEPNRPKQSIEELQREGREKWLAMRAEQKAAELLMAQTPAQIATPTPEQEIEKGHEKAPDPEKPKLSIEEEQAQARERWLSFRQAQALGQTPQPQKGLEKDQEKGLEQGPSLSKGLDGPEIE